MNKFEDFLSEGSKIQIKRKYTENHPAKTVGSSATVRNEVLKAMKDGILTEEEFSKILSKISKNPNRWRSTNSKYFFVGEKGIKLSKWGLRILSELDMTPKLQAYPVVNEEAITDSIDEGFKFGKKKQFSIDDINEPWGFWGTLETNVNRDEVEEMFLEVFKILTNNWKFSDEASLYFLNSKEGRHLADAVYSFINTEISQPNMIQNIVSDYVSPAIWKSWSKEYNNIAQEELAENNKNTTMDNNTFIHESFADFTGASGILNEKLGSQLLASILMSGKEGQYAKQNLKSLAGGFYGLAKVALDKVSDEDFIVSNNPSKVFKENGGSKHILFFISDNEKDNPYCPYDAGYGALKTIPGGGTLIAAMSGDREFYTNDWSRYSRDRSFKKDGKKGNDSQVGVSHKYRGWSGTGLNNGKRIAEVSDRVLVINIELIRQKYSTAQLRAARAEAKSGAIAFTDDKDFKKANNDRYHQILATKAASMPLDKMVADAIDMLTDQIKDGLAKGEKTRYDEIKIGQSAKGKEVKLRDASNHMSSVLDDYSRYCDYIRQEEESEKRFGSSESWYKREIKNYALSLKEKIAKIEGFDYAW